MHVTFVVGSTTKLKAIPQQELSREPSGKISPKILNAPLAPLARSTSPKRNNRINYIKSKECGSCRTLFLKVRTLSKPYSSGLPNGINRFHLRGRQEVLERKRRKLTSRGGFPLAVPEKIFALSACSIFSTAAPNPACFLRRWRRSQALPPMKKSRHTNLCKRRVVCRDFGKREHFRNRYPAVCRTA